MFVVPLYGILVLDGECRPSGLNWWLRIYWIGSLSFGQIIVTYLLLHPKM